MRENSVLVDILSLVEINVHEGIVSTWTDHQCNEAEYWACQLIAKANDYRYVRVPKIPEFLIKYTNKVI